jgi:poly-gamma-glutamate capsule biosynthesis protein CapA/YwtB (metallophosphatase superfamily)
VALRIGLLGDVMLGRGVAKTLETVPAADVWSEELRVLVAEECDLVVANLECCLSEQGRRTRLITGKPFFFRGPPGAVEALEAMRVRAVSSANNHALDYGPEALADTLGHLDAAGIAHAGAGLGPEEARRPATADGVTVVAVTDHPAEFAAEEGRWGTAWANLFRGVPGWVADALERARAGAGAGIAFPHRGANKAVAPAHWQRKRAAELLEAGADLVAGHSAHVFHGIERVDGRPVLYDLGDALDDYLVDDDLRNDLGLLALWRPGENPDLELVGLRGDYCRADVARGADAEWIARRLERACGDLGTSVQQTGEARFTVL